MERTRSRAVPRGPCARMVSGAKFGVRTGVLEMPADVAHDADNFAVVAAINGALADGISIREEAARKRLVDEHHLARRSGVVAVKVAAGKQGYAHQDCR